MMYPFTKFHITFVNNLLSDPAEKTKNVVNNKRFKFLISVNRSPVNSYKWYQLNLTISGLSHWVPTFVDLPMWPSGQSTPAPCAVGVMRSAAEVASAYQRIISINSYAHDEQGGRQEKEGSTMSAINCDCWLVASRCWPRWHGWSK